MSKKYTIMNDGQYMWPVRTASLKAFIAQHPDADPFADHAIPIPDEYRSRIGYGPGSSACIEICEHLLADGADEIRPPQANQ